MRDILSTVVMLTMCVPFGILAAGDAKPADFAGTWQAKVNNTVACTLELKSDNGISGAFQGCNIHVDADGNLEEPQEPVNASSSEPISHARIKGEVLMFESVEDSDGGPVKLEMTIVSRGEAELRITNAPVKIKPIRFLRTSVEKQ